MRKIFLPLVMLATSWAANASDFMVGELCYNITDSVAMTAEVAEYDYKVDGKLVKPTNPEVVVPLYVTNPADSKAYQVTALGVNGLKYSGIFYTKITLPEGLLTIKEGALTYQKEVKELVLPSTLKTINSTFQSMEGLTELTIPESVESMTSIETFYLKKLTIKGCPTIVPKSGEYVAGTTTMDMTYLLYQASDHYGVDIVLESKTPPVLPQLSAIYYSDILNSKFSFVHVPNDCSDAYNAAGWDQATIVAEGYGDPDEYKTVNNIRYYRDSHRAIGVSVVAPISGTLRVPSSILFGTRKKRLPTERLSSDMLQRGNEDALASLDITGVYFGTNMKIIDARALYSPKVKVDSLTIPATVESVGSSFINTQDMRILAFAGAPKIAYHAIESVPMVRFLSETLPTVEEGALLYSSTDVIAPSVGAIDDFQALFPNNPVFAGYAQADGITYAQMKDLNAAAIYSDKSLTEATIKASIEINGTTAPVKRLHNSTFLNNAQLTKITLPEGLTAIGSTAMANCEMLADLQLPTSVEAIGYSAFKNCKKWTAAIALSNLKSLGKEAFTGSAITSADFTGAPITDIPQKAFYGCDSLKSVVLPEGLTTIGERAFSGCSTLSEINIPESVTSIGAQAFLDCKEAKTLTVPQGLTSLGLSAFSGSGLTGMLRIPETINEVPDSAFCGTQLTSVVLPSTLLSIGEYAFDSTDLTDLTSLAVTPPVIANENAFSNYSAHLIVPKGAIDAYAAADIWKLFSNIGNLTTDIASTVSDRHNVSVTADGSLIHVQGLTDTALIKVYNLSGALIYSGTARTVEVTSPGLYIVAHGQGAVKVLVR